MQPASSIIRRKDTDNVKSSRMYKFTSYRTAQQPAQASLDISAEGVLPSAVAVRCLRIAEVSDLIMGHFHRGYLKRRHRAELLNIMLSTKSLFYPACAVLWRKMDGGLDPLFDLLDLMEIDRGLLRAFQENPNAEYACSSFRPPIPAKLTTNRTGRAVTEAMRKSDGWNNFLFYASLIESATCHARTIEPDLLPFISSAVRDHSPILCSLTSLYWVEDGLPSDSLLCLVGSRLRSLRVQVRDCIMGEDDDHYEEWVSRLGLKIGQLCPNIRTFRVHAYWHRSYDLRLTPFFEILHTADVIFMDAEGEYPYPAHVGI